MNEARQVDDVKRHIGYAIAWLEQSGYAATYHVSEAIGSLHHALEAHKRGVQDARVKAALVDYDETVSVAIKELVQRGDKDFFWEERVADAVTVFKALRRTHRRLIPRRSSAPTGEAVTPSQERDRSAT